MTPAAGDPRAEIVRAAQHADWQQVVLNGGPPCFHLCEDGHFCFRAERWPGHGVLHAFVSLSALLHADAPTREGWQPIDSAPKDGTRVLLHPGPQGYSVVGRRSLTNRWWESLPGKYQIQPTHWTPLPQFVLSDAETAREQTQGKPQDFTQSFDAMTWAEAFAEIARTHPNIATDTGTMVGWFANALMRGFDEHAKRNPQPSGDPRDETLAALKNSGIDITCGACMEVAFTGVTTNAHTCSGDPRVAEVITVLECAIRDDDGALTNNRSLMRFRRAASEALALLRAKAGD